MNEKVATHEAIDRVGRRANTLRDGNTHEMEAAYEVIKSLLPHFTRQESIPESDLNVLDAWLKGASQYPPDEGAIEAGRALVESKTETETKAA